MPYLPRRTTTVGAAAGLLLVGQVALAGSIPFDDAGDGAPVRDLVVSLGVPGRAADARTGQLLAPGSALPLDLTVSNPYRVRVSLTSLEVRVSSVRPHGPEGCTPAGFTTTAGRLDSVQLPPGRSTTLAQAGVPPQDWPSVTMTQAAADQLGCRDAELRLAFSVRGRLA